MKCTCVQCGKSFELSDSEIDFYRKKNLHLPKRCMECRQANKQKQGRASKDANDWNAQNQYDLSPRQDNNKISKWVYGFIAVAIVLLILGIKISRSDFTPYDEDYIYSAETTPNADTKQYVFRSPKLLEEHYQKHGIEMGFSSMEEYQAAASAVVNNENSLHKLEAEDGDDVYYLEATNDFVIVSTDGYIRTYFRPNNGIEYYNKQ